MSNNTANCLNLQRFVKRYFHNVEKPNGKLSVRVFRFDDDIIRRLYTFKDIIIEDNSYSPKFRHKGLLRFVRLIRIRIIS